MSDLVERLVRDLSLQQKRALSALLQPHAIAVVGMGCRMPGGVQTPEALWELLANGTDAVTEVPKSRFDIDAFYDADPLAPGKTYSRHGAFLDGVDLFDADFFGITHTEAAQLDPQQRLLLETSWEAFERAGCGPLALAGSRTGVFVAVGGSDYLHLCVAGAGPEGIRDGLAGPGTAPSMAAGRIAHTFDLRGPAVSLDTACSSSLVAIHLACESLIRGETDRAIAGGVNLVLIPHSTILSSKLMAMAPDGRCKTFDADANGYVRGEGCGMIVLKRLADAVADRDSIIGVIGGTAVNHDGRSSSLTAPSGLAQGRVIRAALARSGLDPEDITYVEAHGTGTPLGDPIELQALEEALRSARPVRARLHVGSIKTNVGHLEGAAGVSGLMKLLLMLGRAQIPPHLHLRTRNPNVAWDHGAIDVPTKLTPWPSNGKPRAGGVSAFSFSGTNAHLIATEAPARAPTAAASGERLLCLSARTPSALNVIAQNLATALERRDAPADLTDVAYTLNVGRSAFTHRRAVVVSDLAQAAAILRAPSDANIINGTASPREPRVAFMFPGLGEQYPGMAAGLCDREPAFEAAFSECAELFSTRLGINLRATIHPDAASPTKPGARDGTPTRTVNFRAMLAGTRGERPEPSALDRTLVAQPAIFAVEYALAKLLTSLGIYPSAMIGYSIGEYVAACLAGVMSLKDAIALVAERATAIDALPSGAMLAIALSEKAVKEHLRPGVTVSGVNGPALTVVGGPPADVEALAAELGKLGVVSKFVRTTHAFHTPLMTPAADALRSLGASFALAAPTIPFVSNVTGRLITTAEATDPEYWARHLCAPVRFADGIRALDALHTRGDHVLLEVGPGQTLASFAMQVEGHQGRRVFVPTLRASFDAQSDHAFLLRAIGRVWSVGVSVDWEAFHAHQAPARVILPTYPFERARHWADSASTANRVAAERPMSAPSNKAEQDPLTTKKPLDEWFHVPSWVRTPPRPFSPRRDAIWVVFALPSTTSDAVVSRLRAAGENVHVVWPGTELRQAAGSTTIDPREPAHYRAVFDGLLASAPSAALRIVHGFCLEAQGTDSLATLEATLDRGIRSALLTVQASLHGMAGPIRYLTILVSCARSVTGTERVRPLDATLLGIARVLPLEAPTFRCQVVDLPDLSGSGEVVERLLGDLTNEPDAAIVAYRGAHRWKETLVAQAIVPTPAQPKLRDGAVVLVTGGLGAVAMALAEDLVRACGARLILVTRTLPPPRAEWARRLASEPDSVISDRIRGLQALDSAGAEVVLEAADVADLEAMGGVVDRAKQRFGRIDGVLHTAAAFSGGFMALATREGMNATLAPKVRGTLVLERILGDQRLDFFILCSSLSGTIGAPGQFAYVGANSFLDAFAEGSHLGPVLSVAWDDWTVGSAYKAEGPAELNAWRRKRRELTAMTTSEGTEVLRRALATGLPGVAIATHDIEARRQEFAAMANASSLALLRPRVRPRPEISATFVAPSSEAEIALGRIWEEVLGVEAVGIHDPFLDLGGHSLLAIQLLTRVREAFGVDVSLRQLFEARTLHQLAAVVEGRIIDELEAQASPPPKREETSLRSRLPNGMEVACQSLAETEHFYEDIFVHRVYAKHGIEVADKGVIFDVGANVGLFTLFAHQTWPRATIYAFEPAPPLFKHLRANATAHGVPACLTNAGVGRASGTMELTYYPYSSGMSSFYADVDEEKEVLRAIIRNRKGNADERSTLAAHEEELLEHRFVRETFACPITTISASIREHGVERIDLLKVDVQKAELEVLAGIADEDWKKIRHIAVEVHDIDGRVAALQALLKNHRFRVVVEQDAAYAGSTIFNLYATSAAADAEVRRRS